MKKPVSVLVVSLSLLPPGIAGAADWSGNLNLLFGGKQLNKDDWNADKQAEVGLLLDFKKQDWPFSIATDVHFAQGDNQSQVSVPPAGTGLLNEHSHTCDFNLGVRKYWEPISRVRPFAGGGVAYGQAEIDQWLDGVSTLTDRGYGYGAWLSAGMLWTFKDSFNLGFDMRYSKLRVSWDSGHVESGGAHAGVMLGYHW